MLDQDSLAVTQFLLVLTLAMGKHYFKKLAVATVALVTFGAVALSSSTVLASEGRSYGIDESRYQGYTTYKRYNQDEFAIAQIGGSQGGYIYDQATYNSQVSTGIANG